MKDNKYFIAGETSVKGDSFAIYYDRDDYLLKAMNLGLYNGYILKGLEVLIVVRNGCIYKV